MLLRQIQRNFETLAKEDPYWTVLADNAKRDSKWDPEEFYQTGVALIDDLQSKLAAKGVELGGERVLDFGCGVGRLSYPLSQYFEECIGIDISASMIETAKKHASRGNNCQFILNAEPTLDCLEERSLDFAYSDIVFQHIPPRYAKGYFREIAQALKPGGHFVFQMPSHLNMAFPDNQRPLRLLKKRFYYLTKSLLQSIGIGKAYFEMNAIPRERLIHYVESSCRLQFVTDWDYPAAGPAWICYLYVFKKPD